MMRRLLSLAAPLLLTTGFMLVSSTAAHADTQDCRSAARDLNNAVMTAGSHDAGQSAINAAVGAHPECAAEYTQLIQWYAAGGTTAFPFPAASDPGHSFLGPIGWWWNIVYIKWFGRSIVMMVLFGWEIFLVPICMALGLIGSILGSIGGRRAYA